MPKLPPPKLIFLAFDGHVTLTFRQVVDSSGSVVLENHYYPYGALMGESTDILAANGAGSSDTNPYKFGGKELLAAQNANLGVYPARVLDFSSNTWAQSDPCCEDYAPTSPYVNCLGNPISLVDPDGKKVAVLLADDVFHIQPHTILYHQIGQRQVCRVHKVDKSKILSIEKQEI